MSNVRRPQVSMPVGRRAPVVTPPAVHTAEQDLYHPADLGPMVQAGPQNYLPLHPPILPGIGPMPAPVSDPQNYPVVIPDPPEVLTGQVIAVANGQGAIVARAFYGRSRAMMIYVGIDLTRNAQYVASRFAHTTVAGSDREVCVLADITWGAGGTTFQATVNVPIGQVVQIPIVAQSVDVSARLGLPTNIGPEVTNLQVDVPLNPPLLVSAFIAEGIESESTATRRAWQQLGIGGTTNYEIPAMTRTVQIMGGPNIKYAWQITSTGMLDIPDAAPTPIANPGPGQRIPVPNSAKGLIIFNTNGAAAEAFEVQFNLF